MLGGVEARPSTLAWLRRGRPVLQFIDVPVFHTLTLLGAGVAEALVRGRPPAGAPKSPLTEGTAPVFIVAGCHLDGEFAGVFIVVLPFHSSVYP